MQLGKDEKMGKHFLGIAAVLLLFGLAMPTALIGFGMTPQVASLTTTSLGLFYLAGKSQEKSA